MKSPVELKYITLVQIVGCCLVVFGHSFPFVAPYPDEVTKWIAFLYTFHMPLFVWCSGFLFAHTMQSDRKTFTQYACQRAVKLLVPYFLISLIGLVPKITASSFLNDTLSLDVMSVARAFLVPREGVWGHFWFLPMICITGIIAMLFDKISKKNTCVWILITVIAFVLSFYESDCLSWGGLNDVLQYFMFYSIGVLCSRSTLNIGKAYRFVPIAVAVAIVLFTIISGDAVIVHSRNAMIALLMIFSIVEVCKIFENKIQINRKSLIAQTYQIFILSWPCQLVMGIILERILHLNWIVFVPVVFATGVIGPLVLLELIDSIENKTHTKYISFVLGR